MDTATQIAEILNSLQTAACLRRERTQWRCKQIAEGFFVSTSNTSAHLMQVAQTKILRLVYYYGIGIRNVYTTFDYGCCQKYIVIIIYEIEDNLFKFLRLHLPVTYTYTAIRYVSFYQSLQLNKVLYAVVHKEHLTVTAHLEIYSLGYNLLVESMYLCLYRISVWRRCLYHGKVSCAHKRELQCSRNRCGRHSKCINIHLYLTEFFLHTYPELLFLVYDKQAQILELDTLAYYLVSSYKDIYLPVGKLFQNSTGILGRTCTTKIFHLARQSLKSFFESLEMLVCKNCCWDKYCHLLIVCHSLESRSYGNFRLTETHVSTDKSVHRTVALHIGFHLLCSFRLVRSIFIQERSFQLMLQETVRTVLETFFLFALRIKFYKVAGYVLYLGLGAFLDFLPRTCTQFADSWRLAFLALIFGNLMKRMD